MAIDLETEQLITLSAATRFFPARRRGKKPSFTCIWRWVVNGIGGVKLDAVKVGGTLCTSKAAIGRFIAAQTANDPRINAGRSCTTSAARRKQIERAEDELAREGF